eukprot:CAMPEP_0177421566 /NCGR_PEP_ID=MMETSP0368-20130122/70852_1 /TAXON_ID=447022 ORGANISM="Scrippsiella hangoei-like, Strain SHHI-4" /NCGR_SAMPLE_ID=MMETSP0368 /ASSEMBLY_ACC=CAM_ASM_000363 /LENGTH=57 /DNA_ID=CAMNT_0018891423 /DNA_START=23 /DNA_END=193 /DNA_ORIENTATION=-
MWADACHALFGHYAMQGDASNYECTVSTTDTLNSCVALGVLALLHWGPMAESMNLFN